MIAVVQRLFQVLEAFSRQSDPASLARLTEATGLPKPTIYRLVQSMVDLGYLHQDPTTGFYLRTGQLESLGQGSLWGHLRQRIQPKMDELLDHFDESISLTVMTGQKVHCLLAAETRRPLCYRLGRGTGSLPYYLAASGRAIVSQLPPEEIKALLEQTQIEPMTPKSIKSKKRLRQILAQSSKNGWGYQEEECETGICSVATPLFEGKRPIAALAIIVPMIRFNDSIKRSMISALKQASR